MTLTIKFIGALRHISGKTQITVSCPKDISLKDLVENLSQDMPSLKKTLVDQQLSDARSNALVLVNGKEISALEGLETKLCDGDEIVFVPVVHGG